jgi:adenylate kinase family enzyme
MGKTLRALTSNDNLIGNYVKNIMERGDMIDNYITHYLVLTGLHIAKKNDKYIMIDGFPRLMEQADFFIEKEVKLERDFVVIQYVLPKEKAIERLMSRAKLESRDDDTLEAMNTRIAIFENETIPVLKHFEDMGKLVRIDAEGSIEEIFEATKKAL